MLTTDPFIVEVKLNCKDDVFTPTFEWTSPTGASNQHLAPFISKIETDSGRSDSFITVTSSLAHCTPYYSLFKEDATGTYVPYTDTNSSIDIISLIPTASPTSTLITTSVADDAALDNQQWKLRVSVASKTPFSEAVNSQHIYFTVTFEHPCKHATIKHARWVVPDIQLHSEVYTINEAPKVI